MIDLTPLEVRKKKGDFRKAMRGYEPQAVDDFLDLVADRLEQLVRENAALQERAGSIASQVSDYRERERALTEALVTAQEMREQMRVQVEREVELKLREAEADIEAMRAGAAQQREREEESIRRLRARQSQFVQSYRGFLERELAELSVMAQTLDLSSQDELPQQPPPPRKRGRKAEPAPPAPQPFTPPPPTVPPAPPIAEMPLRMPEPEPAFDMTAPFEPEMAFEPEAPFDEPQPMPLPAAEIEMEPDAFGEFDTFEEPQHDLIDLSMHFPEVPPESEPEPAAPPAQPIVPPTQTAPPPPAPAPPQPSIGSQIDFGEPPMLEDLPEPQPELELLDMVDEEPASKKKDDDADGWVSTLLEGKGD